MIYGDDNTVLCGENGQADDIQLREDREYDEAAILRQARRRIKPGYVAVPRTDLQALVNMGKTLAQAAKKGGLGGVWNKAIDVMEKALEEEAEP